MNLKNADLTEEIFSTLWNSDPDKYERVNLDDFCIFFLKKKYPNLSALEINDIAESLRPYLIKSINKKIQNCIERNITPNWETIHSDYLLIRPYLNESDSDKSYRKKILISFRNKIIRILHKIPGKNFEYFCKYLFKEIYGFSDVLVTSHTRDGGIDLLAKKAQIISKSPDLLRLIPDIKIIAFAEVKNWTANIGEPQIINFIKNAEDLKTGNHKIIRKYKEFFLDHTDKIISIFITTSYFSKESIRRALKEEIRLIDGEQVIEDFILLSSRSLLNKFFKQENGNTLHFDEEAFENWIMELK